MRHEMKLNNDPFNKMKDGSKTIERRLNDEKRQLLKVGDLIEFTNRDTGEKLLTRVEELYHFPTFAELHASFDKIAMGYNPDEEVHPDDMDEYYSKEEQAKYGVLAIEIIKL